MTGPAPDGIEDFFADLRDYPGKRKPIGREPKPPPEAPAWDAKSRMKYLNGVKREFFTIGHVALAMNRSIHTIRWWEKHEIIPPAPFRDSKPRKSKLKEAGDRLWSREHVEAMVRAAQEEGVLDGKQPSRAFTAKIVRAFLALQQRPNSNT
jgi:hypothetical protein